MKKITLQQILIFFFTLQLFAQNYKSSLATGNAMRFEGNSGLATIPDSNAFDLTNTITVECLVKMNKNISYHNLVHKASDGGWTGGYGFDIEGNTLHFFPFGWGSNWAISSTPLALNTWYHVAATYNGSEIKLYINGILDKTEPMTGNMPVNSYNINIGTDGGPYIANSDIDMVRIWNVVRTQAEIFANKNSCINSGTTGLVAQYDFETTAAGLTFPDTSGNNYTGNYSNMVASRWVAGSSCGIFLSNEDFEFNSKLSISPNPSSDMFNINIDSDATIEVFDIIGKPILNRKITLGTSQLDMSNYNTGMYLLKVINSNNQTKTVKIVKQ
jgi:hypothetical protein